jgi:hypothetical protein
LVTNTDGNLDELNHMNGWNTLQMVLKEAGKIKKKMLWMMVE